MSSVVAAHETTRPRSAVIALAFAAVSVALNLIASIADVDDLYLPAIVLGLVAIALGVRARRVSHRGIATAAIVAGAFAPGATLVYLVVIGLGELL